MKLGKRLEIGAKHAASALVRSFVAQPPRAPAPPYARILFIRYGGIGDMILSLPVLRAVRARFPAAAVDVLCDRKNVAPLCGAGLAEHIDFYDKRPQRIAALARRLRRRRYDYVCNLVVYPSFTFGMLARAIGPGAVRAAGDQGRFAYFYNRLIELPPKRSIHMLERLFRLAVDLVEPGTGAGTGAAPPAPPWVEYGREVREAAREVLAGALEAVDARTLAGRGAAGGTLAGRGAAGDTLAGRPPRLAAINLSAGLARREWPLERWVELLRVAAGRHRDQIHGWLVLSDPARPGLAARFIQAAAGCDRPVVLVPPQRDFRVVMELLRRVRLLVTPDTSLAHAASAVGTPVLDLMIGENVTTWAPVGVAHEVVAAADPLSLRALPVADVLAGLERLLGALG